MASTTYAFTAGSLAPTASEGDLAGSTMVATGATVATSSSLGYSTGTVAQIANGTASLNTGRYVEFTIDGGPNWSLTSIVLKAARGGSSTPRGFQVRTSADSYAANLPGAGDIGTTRPTWTTFTINTSSVTTRMAPLTIRIYPYMNTGSIEIDDVVVTAAVNVGSAMTYPIDIQQSSASSVTATGASSASSTPMTSSTSSVTSIGSTSPAGLTPTVSSSSTATTSGSAGSFSTPTIDSASEPTAVGSASSAGSSTLSSTSDTTAPGRLAPTTEPTTAATSTASATGTAGVVVDSILESTLAVIAAGSVRRAASVDQTSTSDAITSSARTTSSAPTITSLAEVTMDFPGEPYRAVIDQASASTVTASAVLRAAQDAEAAAATGTTMVSSVRRAGVSGLTSTAQAEATAALVQGLIAELSAASDVTADTALDLSGDLNLASASRVAEAKVLVDATVSVRLVPAARSVTMARDAHSARLLAAGTRVVSDARV